VTHLGVLDVLPTVDNWVALTGPAGVFAFHLYLLAQPTTLPERLIAADPDTFFGHFLDIWTVESAAIGPDLREHYLAAARRSSAIHAICDDYRAGAFIDNEDDARDQQAGRRLAMPVLAAWQDPGDTPLPFRPAGDLVVVGGRPAHGRPEVRTLPPRGAARRGRRGGNQVVVRLGQWTVSVVVSKDR
jgi:haloacetate dehalogenase